MEGYYDVGDLLTMQALPLEAPNFLERGPLLSDPDLLCSFQNLVDMVTRILTKALSKMEQITETGGHVAVNQVVRLVVNELLPIL
jgi:hypothetical protein